MTTMYDPVHPGESLRDAMDAEKWTVTEAAAKLGCTRQTFSRLLNGRTGISPAMALALERIGWSNAVFWVRRQGAVQTRTRTFTPEENGRMTRRTSERRWPVAESGKWATRRVQLSLISIMIVR